MTKKYFPNHNIIGEIMTVFIYIFIFLAKVVENALATLRLIVVADGKKWFGAILSFVTALIWVLSTAYVVLNIEDDPFKVVAFAIGTFLGSYFGSLIEEKTRVGTNLLMIAVNPIYSNEIKNKLIQFEYKTFILKTTNEDIILTAVPRKKGHKVITLVHEIDKNAIIISESAKLLLNKLSG